MEKKKFYAAFYNIVFIAILMYWPVASSAQVIKKYPQNYFRWPLDIKPDIVANMGELRNNHWHMGLDIRTNQRENLPVYAAAAGYISKIRIERSGFGRAIFITHPNGFTTLYGHLNAFFPALEEYVTQQQYSQQTWAIELDFSRDKFPVTKGQFIAYSGSTGASQGPHVHFEIRDTKTGVCLNPMLFGMPLQDNVRPSLSKLAMYDRSGSIYEEVTRFYPLKNTDNGYAIAGTPVIKAGSRRLSFAIQAFDRISGSKNENGIYSAELFFDESPVINFILDSIGYDKTRYLNAHIDYKYHFNGGPFFQHLSRLPGEHSGVYHPLSGDGTIDLPDKELHSVRIEIRDPYQNVSQLRFSIQYDSTAGKQEKFYSAAQKFLPGTVNVLERPDFEMYLPEASLYDTLTSFYNRTNSASANAVSAIHQVNDPSVPVMGELTVRIKPDRIIPESLKDKIVIQRSYRSSEDVRKAEWNGEWLTAKFGDFGDYQAFTDTQSPVISGLGEGDTLDLSGTKRIVLQPRDNFGVIKNFRAELDGKWLRFTNDKGRLYIYIFDEHCRYGIHELKVTAEDLVGNTTTKTWWFKKYAYKAPVKKKTAHKGGKSSKKSTIKKKTTRKK